MQSTPSLPSLPGPLWPGVVAPDRVLSKGQIELSSVFMLNGIVWKELFICIKMNLALNNLQSLMCHKTKPNQAQPNVIGVIRTIHKELVKELKDLKIKG